ncbi:MAG: glycosyl hydrolase family 28 protein [Bacteroidota bacterium]|nr:glycosyl hydrolase family 28 protein [Bacteroidota bacterium]MDP4225852.1 glycosyl hydrolase family 28 protein [Bacteroidota bacterium]MDP4273853.1 glycosyl hydrolase family 28 protein [Bacteroidota bacterium]
MKLRLRLFYIFFSLAGCYGLNSVNIDAATLPVIPNAVFDITNYGAVSSTIIDNTSSIQKTIEACSLAGGGKVLIPAGTFLSGPISMKSNINLQISSGAVLRMLPYGSGNGTVAGSYPNSGTADDYTDFIYGKNLNNIEVSGSGLIDGQGSDWWTAYKANKSISRPCMIRFDACTNIAVLGISLQNAPNVHITIGKSSSNATISNITITAPSSSPNTDGIDVWSPNVEISGCNIACGDDNIAMDSGSQNVFIKNCTFGVGHGCSIGSYAADISNIKVDSCSFTGTTSGIRMKTARGRGGSEQYLYYSNITMSGVTNPIYITSYYPSTPSTPSSDTTQAITSTTPSWQHIVLKNITISGSSNAGVFWGLPERSINDVVLDNVKISASSGVKAYFITGLVFKNGSSVTVTSGNAVSTYSATVSGIKLTTGEPSYIISVKINPLNSGSVSGTGTFSFGQAVSLSVASAAGYNFSKWTEGKTDVSINPALTFTADSDRTVTANFTSSTGLENISENNTLSVYPNPCRGKFYLQLDNDFIGEIKITITNVVGCPLKIIRVQKENRFFTQEINMENFSKGVYIINIPGVNTMMKKLILD